VGLRPLAGARVDVLPDQPDAGPQVEQRLDRPLGHRRELVVAGQQAEHDELCEQSKKGGRWQMAKAQRRAEGGGRWQVADGQKADGKRENGKGQEAEGRRQKAKGKGNNEGQFNGPHARAGRAWQKNKTVWCIALYCVCVCVVCNAWCC
jgi:hypothetical protein